MQPTIKSAYNKWASIYDSVDNPTRDLDKQVLKHLLPPLTDKIVLEVGCGTGKNTTWIAPAAQQVFAFDFSEQMLQKAKEKVTASNVEFKIHDILREWSYPAEFCDIVTINLVLEHIQDIEFVFEQAYQVLNHNGKCVICELHPERQQIGKQAQFIDPDNQQVVKIDSYYHSKEEYLQAAENAGFSKVKFTDWFDDRKKAELPRLLSIEIQK